MKRFVAAVDWYGDTDFEPITFVIDSRVASTAAKRALGWARSHAKKEDTELEPYIVGMAEIRLGSWVGAVSDRQAGDFSLVFLTD